MITVDLLTGQHRMGRRESGLRSGGGDGVTGMWRQAFLRYALLSLAAFSPLPAGGLVAQAADPSSVEAIVAPEPAASTSSAAVAPIGIAEPIGPLEVQCGAVRNSSAGNLLAAKRAAVGMPRGRSKHSRHAGDAHVASTKRGVLALAAEEARNRDAGSALEAYWSLAAAEHSLPEVDAALAAIATAITDRETLAGRGLEVPVEDASLRDRQLALDDARIEVTAAIDSLSLAVGQLAGLPPGTVRTVYPGTGGGAIEDLGDVDALVAEGLARRPELRMLRLMLANLDDDTADLGKMVLSLANPALAADEPASQSCGLALMIRLHGPRDCDTASVRSQLQRMLRDREAAVETEIRQAARLAAAAAARVPLANQRRAMAEQAALDARARQRVGDADAFGVHLTDVEAAAARRAVVERRADWERARAKVWQAQGTLAAACGCH